MWKPREISGVFSTLLLKNSEKILLKLVAEFQLSPPGRWFCTHSQSHCESQILSWCPLTFMETGQVTSSGDFARDVDKKAQMKRVSYARLIVNLAYLKVAEAPLQGRHLLQSTTRKESIFRRQMCLTLLETIMIRQAEISPRGSHGEDDLVLS